MEQVIPKMTTGQTNDETDVKRVPISLSRAEGPDHLTEDSHINGIHVDVHDFVQLDAKGEHFEIRKPRASVLAKYNLHEHEYERYAEWVWQVAFSS